MMIIDAEEHPSGPDMPFFSVLISGGRHGEGRSREADEEAEKLTRSALILLSRPSLVGPESTFIRRTAGEIRKRLCSDFVCQVNFGPTFLFQLLVRTVSTGWAPG